MKNDNEKVEQNEPSKTSEKDESSPDPLPDYSKHTVKDLRKMLGDRNLPKTGRKAELVERLEQDDAKDA